MSNKTFYVTSEETCDKCEGNGFVYSEAWAKWNEAFNRFDAPEAAHVVETGARERPWHIVFDEYVREHPQPNEPEELTCGDCEGAGQIVRRVNLEEVLLGSHLAERLAQLEVYVSELRYRAGATAVDELREQADADHCAEVGAGRR